MSSWDDIVEQHLVTEGHCSAGGLANAADCGFYAAAPVADGEGWRQIWSEEHEQEIQVDEGRFESRTIRESELLLNAITTATAPLGIWLGKTKYKLVQTDRDFEVAGRSVVLLFANRPKGGIHVCSTGTTVVVGVYNEDLGQTSGNCRRAVLKLAEYLLDNGY